MSKKNYKLGLRINAYEHILDSLDYIKFGMKDLQGDKEVLEDLNYQLDLIHLEIQEMKKYDKEFQEGLKLDMNLESTGEILYYSEKDLED